MEEITKRYDIMLQALVTLKRSLDVIRTRKLSEEDYQMMRDSVIKRFEYSIDTFWKFLKLYLQEHLQVILESLSPRPILRKALEANLMSIQEYEIISEGIINRNETSHSYNEKLAEEIVHDIPEFYEAMYTIIKRIKF